MSDIRYRPPQSTPDLSLTDHLDDRRWLRLLALVVVPALMFGYWFLELESHALLIEYVLPATSGVEHKGRWDLGLAIAGAFGAVDIVIALLAHRPLARVYGRWAVVVACLVVLPTALPMVWRALEQTSILGHVVRWSLLASGSLPMVLLTAHAQRRLRARALPQG